MRVSINESIDAIAAVDWDALNRHNYPFLRHAFLQAAESTGCVAPETGWQARHVAVRDDDDLLVAAMPMYEKTHSWGEFVFDWAWAQAYERAGMHYYPKLVAAVPFTPARSHRMLLADPDDTVSPRLTIEAALRFARDSGQSSLHIQFPHDEELPALRSTGLKLRKDCQFHWRNRGFRTFDEFLGTFSSRKRKKARRDRRHVAEQGITFRHLHGDEISAAELKRAHELISLTFLQRGSLPYYSLEFFERLVQTMPKQLLIVLAGHGGEDIAAAIFFVGPDTLYGRYWGSAGRYDSLHFETCYYQGIEYCISHGLQVFEPGTQGEHKISRGFDPVTTWSAHWLAHEAFFAAIGQYLEEEEQHIDRYIEAVEAHTPYRDTRNDD